MERHLDWSAANMSARHTGESAHIEQIIDDAIASGLAEPQRRVLLLDGLPPELTSRLPVHNRPAEQLISDVKELSRIDGSVVPPDGALAVWRANADRLVARVRRRRRWVMSGGLLVVVLVASVALLVAFSSRGPWPGQTPIHVRLTDGASLWVDRDEMGPDGWAWCQRTPIVHEGFGDRVPSATGMTVEEAAECCAARDMRLPTAKEFMALAEAPPEQLPMLQGGEHVLDTWLELLERLDVRRGVRRLGTGAAEMTREPDHRVRVVGQPTLPSISTELAREFIADPRRLLQRVEVLTPDVYRGPRTWLGFRCVRTPKG